MSRIGKAPISVPTGVTVDISGQTVSVKGPKGLLQRVFRSEVTLRQEGNVIYVERLNDERQARSLHGLSRTLLANMVLGVSQGFEKRLDIIGVGYRAAVTGNVLTLNVGYSNPVELPLPEGVVAVVEANTKLTISGYDKQAVGDFSALIRKQRPPEPYKGKGIKYTAEQIRRKAGKSGKKK